MPIMITNFDWKITDKFFQKITEAVNQFKEDNGFRGDTLDGDITEDLGEWMKALANYNEGNYDKKELGELEDRIAIENDKFEIPERG